MQIPNTPKGILSALLSLPGMNRHRLAQASGVSHATLQRILEGKSISRGTEQKLLQYYLRCFFNGDG